MCNIILMLIEYFFLFTSKASLHNNITSKANCGATAIHKNYVNAIIAKFFFASLNQWSIYPLFTSPLLLQTYLQSLSLNYMNILKVNPHLICRLTHALRLIVTCRFILIPEATMFMALCYIFSHCTFEARQQETSHS